MATLQIVGLLLAIAFMIIGAYKGIPALPLTLMAALVVILFNGMPVWESFASFYMGGYAGTYSAYFLIFIFSALYAKIMDTSKSTTAIGYKLIDWFGKKNVALVTVIIISVLTFGGVSLFVVIFAAGPIAFLLFKEANLPRHLMMGCLTTGAATYTMTSLPASPQLTNIIPTAYLGTTMTAAPVLGVIASVALFVMCMGYLKFAEGRALARGEVWTYPEHIDRSSIDIQDRSALPAAWKAFLPMIVLIAIIVVGSQMGVNASMLTVIAMLVGSALAFLLNIDKFKGHDWRKIAGAGLNDGISAIGGLAAVVSFGTVVQNSPGFQSVVQWVLGFDMHPYLQGIFSTAVISGITGSSSGGLRITLETLGANFVASGANMETLHRLMSIAAGSLDTLPHASGLFLMLAYLGLTHKDGYRHVFATSVAIPAIVVLVATFVMIAIGG